VIISALKRLIVNEIYIQLYHNRLVIKKLESMHFDFRVIKGKNIIDILSYSKLDVQQRKANAKVLYELRRTRSNLISR